MRHNVDWKRRRVTLLYAAIQEAEEEPSGFLSFQWGSINRQTAGHPQQEPARRGARQAERYGE